ncbi:MAG: hypothetical protein L6R39_001925 [Caloplaca ligustica]|nr:MAG: hypothetical protein L6R39_001925 [Caloplaca ligustica]
MTHEVDGEYQAPTVGQGHDQTFDRGAFKSILQKDVDKSGDGACKHDELISSVRSERVDEAVFGSSIARVDVLAEKGKDEPERAISGNAIPSLAKGRYHVKAKVNQSKSRSVKPPRPIMAQDLAPPKAGATERQDDGD